MRLFGWRSIKYLKKIIRLCQADVTVVDFGLSPDEINQIERFKILTPEQHALWLSTKKEKGKYTEAVLLSPRLQQLFRVIPPRLYLAMAMTEQEEKHARQLIM